MLKQLLSSILDWESRVLSWRAFQKLRTTWSKMGKYPIVVDRYYGCHLMAAKVNEREVKWRWIRQSKEKRSREYRLQWKRGNGTTPRRPSKTSVLSTWKHNTTLLVPRLGLGDNSYGRPAYLHWAFERTCLCTTQQLILCNFQIIHNLSSSTKKYFQLLWRR